MNHFCLSLIVEHCLSLQTAHEEMTSFSNLVISPNYSLHLSY